MQPSIIKVTTNYMVQNSDYTILVDAALGAVDISLLINSLSIKGRIYVIKKIDATKNAVTVIPDGTGPDLIDGQSLFVINTTNESVTIQADGNGNWRIL